MTPSFVGAPWDDATQKLVERLAPAGAGREPAAEAALLARICAKDDRACEALVRHYTGGLFALARRLLRREQEAQDVVRETFSAAFRSASLPDGTGLAASLDHLLIRTALAKLHHETGGDDADDERLLPRFDPRGEHASPVEDWVPLVAREDERAVTMRVGAAIAQLSLALRASLILDSVKELTAEEAANV